MIKKYIKKPIPIEAVQWTGKNEKELHDFCTEFHKDDTGLLYIHTLEGNHYFSDGDYIIKGVRGEFYPCKKDIFLETYKVIE